jgi:hypothetical protein
MSPDTKSRSKVFLLAIAGAVVSTVLGATSQPGIGQTFENAPVPLAATASTSIPALVPYAGIAVSAEGKPLTDPVSITFLIYKDPQGGEALWDETETVIPDAAGKFSVQLGSSLASGLPADLFINGEARWLELHIAGQPQKARTLLASVPYAFKSADTELLAGHGVSDFVTQDQLARLTQLSARSGQQGPAPSSQSNTSGTVTGSGTVGTVPLWTGTQTQGNSEIVQVGTEIGINEPTPGATLDVGGTAIFRGTATLPEQNTATPSAGYRSQLLDFSDSAWSTTTHAPVTQTWRIYAAETGNNTANPTSSLNFQFQNGVGKSTPTVLSIAQNGIISFAPGQTFPTSVTTFPKGATFDAESFMTGSSTDWMLVATNTSSSSKGTILGQASATGIGVEGASPGGEGVEGATDTGYGVYAIANTSGTAVYGGAFGTGPAGSFWSQNASGPAVVVNNIAGGNGISSTATNGYGGIFSNSSTYQATVYASNTGNGNAGSFNNNSASRVALAGVNASSDANAIATYGSVLNGKAVYGTSSNGFAIYGTSLNQTGVHGDGYWTGVEGIAAGGAPALAHFSPANSTVGVFGSAGGVGTSVLPVGVVGVADDGTAGFFENNSDRVSTIQLWADGNAPIGDIFRTLVASTPDGVCGFGSGGTMTCTGQVKSLVTTAAARTVETYSVQSAENWLEDYGSGRLGNGSAIISLDAVFAATVNTGVEYHVFLTPIGDCKGLYVDRKTAGSFEVHELGGGKSDIAFDYKIVAKRTGHESERLVDVTEKLHTELDHRLSPRTKDMQTAPASSPNATEASRTTANEEK